MVSVAPLRLHYFYDPLCGWCYGASPLLLAAADLPEIELLLHGGGMLSAPHNRHVNMEWRGYVMPHDRRIAAISGQPFGDAYYEGLLRSEARLDSTRPSPPSWPRPNWTLRHSACWPPCKPATTCTAWKSPPRRARRHRR